MAVSWLFIGVETVISLVVSALWTTQKGGITLIDISTLTRELNETLVDKFVDRLPAQICFGR